MFLGDGTKAREGANSWQKRLDRLEESLQEARGWDNREAVFFLALSLCGEAGELANELKKSWRSGKDFDEALLKRVAFELADVRMLVYRLAYNLNIDEDTSCDAKIDELDARPLNREIAIELERKLNHDD